MADALFVLAVIVFFAVAALVVVACDRIVGRDAAADVTDEFMPPTGDERPR